MRSRMKKSGKAEVIAPPPSYVKEFRILASLSEPERSIQLKLWLSRHFLIATEATFNVGNKWVVTLFPVRNTWSACEWEWEPSASARIVERSMARTLVWRGNLDGSLDNLIDALHRISPISRKNYERHCRY